MHVRVRYFAQLREIVGRADETLVFEPGTSARTLFFQIAEEHPRLRGLEPHLRVAVNHDFADWDTALAAGDEVAFIPPVSGGSGARFVLTTDPLDAAVVRDLVARREAGAIAVFEGVVRDHTGDREVDWLEYDAYPEMVVAKLRETAGRAAEQWPVEVAIHHRWGRLEIGETAVVIAVSSAHRRDAFRACEWVIDTLKEVVPIWKKEVSPDGSEWKGRGP